MTAGTLHRPVRLLALAAAPVFYQVPLYRALAADPRVELTVLYASSGGVRPYDAGFGSNGIVWDEDLLGGYDSRFVKRADFNNVLDGFFALHDWDVLSELAHSSADVLWVHGYSYLTIWLAIAVATVRGIPILVREEQTLLHRRSAPKRWIRTVVLRALFRRVSALYIGTNNESFFRRFGVSADRLFLAPYCVDNAALQEQSAKLASEREQIRASFGLTPHSGPVILFVGKLIPKKQPLLMLEAYARVRARKQCALVFVGEGEMGEQLRAEVDDKRIPDVRFAGFLNRRDIVRAYASADVFVLPSAHHETWGIVVNEAMNFSLPIVVSDKVGCAPDLVCEGANGFIVPHDDVAEFAQRIELLVSDEQRRRAMGQRSKTLIDRWHYGVAAEGIVEASNAALSRRAGDRT